MRNDALIWNYTIDLIRWIERAEPAVKVVRCDDWGAFMRRFPNLPGQNPSYQRSRHLDGRVDRGALFALVRDGDLVGTVAGEVAERGDPIRDTADRHEVDPLIGADAAAWRVQILPVESRLVPGLWSTGGRLWLHPDLRRSGIATWLMSLLRADLAYRWGTQGHWCWLERSTIARGKDVRTYLYPRAGQIRFVAINDTTGDELAFGVNWMTREEIVEEARRTAVASEMPLLKLTA